MVGPSRARLTFSAAWNATSKFTPHHITRAMDVTIAPSDDAMPVHDKTDVDADWDAFVLNHPEPHAEQLSMWGDLRREEDWIPHKLLLRQNQKLLGGALMLERQILRRFRIGYIARGPLCVEEYNAPRVLAGLTNLARQRRLWYVALSLPYSAHSLIPIMHAAGFFRRPLTIPPSVELQATTILDLSRSAEELFAGFRATLRKQIRRAERAGTIVEVGGASDVPHFLRLVAEHCRRRRVRPNMPGGEFVPKLWSLLAPRGAVEILLARCDGKVICALMTLRTGKWTRAWRIGWDGTHEDAYPNQAIYWEAIKRAQQHGSLYFDFLGINRRDAEALLGGRDRSAPFECPTTYFKVGFGGRIVTLPGEFCYFPNPLVRALLRAGGLRVLRSRWAGKVLNRLHTSAVRR